MPTGVDARDVLDANARTTRAFRGRIVGTFERQGPNAWDPYRLRREDGGEIDVLPGLEVQLERSGPEFRMRVKGRVVRVRWTPGETGPSRTDRDLRETFLASCLEDFANAPGRGAAAVIASKLAKD
jgi:hypothetical protein